MEDRSFTELDLRGMLEAADGIPQGHCAGSMGETLVVITAYPA